MNFHNPNDFWMHNNYDPYKGMNDEERLAAGCLQALSFVGVLFIGLLICLLFCGCTTTQYVPVIETHEQHHWHTDSVKEKDSTYHEKTTIIQQLDSAAMAQYGIQLKAAERAWLVKTAELERQLQQLERLTASRDTVRDSVPVPCPVEVTKEVPAKLTWWQQTRLHLANILLWLLLLVGIIYVCKKHIKRLLGE